MWLFPNYNHVRMVGWPVHAMVVDGSCQFWWWVGGVTLQLMLEKHTYYGHIVSKVISEIKNSLRKYQVKVKA